MPNTEEPHNTDKFVKSIAGTDSVSKQWREAHEETASLTSLDIHHANARLANALAQETEDLIQYRTKFSKFFAWIYLGWIFFITLLLFLRGFVPTFDLSDVVMSVLLGSFTVTILTPAIVLARYLFRYRNNTS